MYDENVTYKVGLNWKDIIIKLIMLILFIVLLVWLIPKNDINVFYDSIYANNINTMKEAAKSYYTVDRLPKSVGDSKSLTLKEMIDNHMIVRFTDKDKNSCDESASKVEITKTSENEYVLKVQLNCGDQKDYILETIGCTSVCQNGECKTVIADNTEKEDTSSVEGRDDVYIDNSDTPTNVDKNGNILSQTTTYYQHRKAIISTNVQYSCPDNTYTLSGTKCIKNTTGATIDATIVYKDDYEIITDALKNDGKEHTVYADYIKTKVSTEYSCPEGYTKNGSYCIKYTDATETPGAITYTCPDGYTLEGTNCKRSYNATYTEGQITYTCDSGDKLNGTTCTKSIDATVSYKYSCPSGYTKNGTSCYKVYTDTKDATVTYNYTCPSGYTKNGTTCTKSTTETINATASTKYGSWINNGTKYYTVSNKAYTGTTSKLVYEGMISGAVCGAPCGNSGIWYKYTYYTRTSTTEYSCPSGYNRNGSKCTRTITDTKQATRTETVTCPSGYTRNGYKCSKQVTDTINATKSEEYSCPSGYTLNGKICSKSYQATKHQSEGVYTCPNGGTLYGKTCVETKLATRNEAPSTYICPTGYTLEGKKCKKTIDADKKDIYSYTCPEGYTKSGDGESTVCSKVVKEEGEYYCPDTEAVLKGDKCVKTIKNEIKEYTCPEGYTLNGTKCTKTSVITVDATATTNTTTTYKYQWSIYQYIEGWEFTGKTKTETSSYVAYQK